MYGDNFMLGQLWDSRTTRFLRNLVLGSVIFLLFGGGVSWGADQANKLIAVAMNPNANNPTVSIKTAEPVGYRYTVYDSFEPIRVVIDFPGMEVSDVAESIAVNQSIVQEIRAVGFDLPSGKLARVEILLAKSAEYQVSLNEKEFSVAFAAEVTASDQKASMPMPVATSSPPVTAPVDASADAKVLRNVTLSPGQAILDTNGKIGKFNYFALGNPPRLVLDVYGLKPGFKERSFSADAGFKAVRVGTYNDKTRLVFDASGNSLPEHLVEGRTTDILVSWGDVKPAADMPAVTAKPGEMASSSTTADSAPVAAVDKAVMSAVPTKAIGPSTVEAIDFNNEAGRSVITVALSAAAQVTGPVEEGSLLRFEIVNSSISRALRRTIDASAFPSAVTSVTPYSITEGDHQNVRIAVALRGPVAYALEQDGSMIRLVVDNGAYTEPVPSAVSQVEVAAPEPMAGNAGQVNENGQLKTAEKDQMSFEGERVNLDFIDANVRMLLRLISDVSNLNIVASDKVGGTMTLRLVDVPWDQALDLILTTNGLKIVQDGNIAHIMTLAEYNDVQQTELNAKVDYQESSQKLRVRETVKIQYVNMESIQELTGMYDDLLVTTNKATKTVVLFGNKPDVEAMVKTIQEVDVPEKQVMIEVRIVEANTSKDLDFGVKWGMTYDNRDTITQSHDLNNAALGLGGGFSIAAPSSGGVMSSAGSALGMSFGALGITDATLDLRLSALEGNGDVRVVSTPRILTLNGNPAKITQGREIPYTTTDEGGNTKTSFKEALLDLTVIPEINPNGSIILDIDLKNDSQGPQVSSGDATAPSIEKKTAKSKILVQDGSTTVIGGVFIDSEDDSHSGVPLLMDVPILGHLFKSTNKKSSRRELLIFITPRIVSGIN